MGRNKYSQHEYDQIRKLLTHKCEGNRAKQKEIRHILRTKYEFNISDFGEPGCPFGPEDLDLMLRKRAILILDDATIADMKEKRARDKARDAEAKVASGETTDWQQALREWNEATQQS